MPRYDYQCAGCGRRFEVVHGLHDDGPTACPLCGAGPVRKAFAPPTIHFKGSGWAKKERRATSSPAPSGDGPAEPAPVAASSAGGSTASGAESTASGAESTASGAVGASEPTRGSTHTGSTGGTGGD